MNTPQDSPPDEKSPFHWVPCSENWENLMIIAVPELNTYMIESNYLDLSTQDIKRSLMDYMVNAESQSTHQQLNSIMRTKKSNYTETLLGRLSH